MNTNLNPLIIGLALIAGVHQTTAQVTNLDIAPAPGGQSVLYWPVSTTNYVLQTTTNLASPDWVMASNAVTVNAVYVTNAAPAGYFRLLATTNTTAGMVLIPAGSFAMGNYLFYNTATNDPEITDALPTNVYVSAFYMDINLVTSNLWGSVFSYATANGYVFYQSAAYTSYAAGGRGTNYPVLTVDWYDCVKWCNARSQQANLTPVYYADAGLTQVFTNGDNGTNVYANWGANGYRLPTEAEWEKAARGGLSGLRFPWGNSIDWNHANYQSYWAVGAPFYSYDLASTNGFDPAYFNGVIPYTSPVGSFAANGYGLYDMAGNVMEWCWDWYAYPPYPAGSPYLGGTDPHGPASGSFRILRGGNWDYDASVARCASRYDGTPTDVYVVIGFRCVRGL
jgi:formylglycine-generating enzyme required for sulfatase activity